ncbi:hypothetical protein [Sutterella sp.]|uniref:hypothetical protein n=1 Tax=Sutterella sp. TaxID=1981025 RepID=UPI0026E02429|nr:hypothetical protein [Sutterella sp.]MDO5532586.1 hypothetical protein [Sutterella sp.]
MTNYAYIGTTPSLIEDLKTEEGRKIFNEACFEQYSDASRAVMFSIGKNNYHVSKQNIAVMQNKAAKPTNEGAKTYAILGGKPVAADPRDTTQAVTHPTPEEIILGGMAGELVEDEPEDKAEPYERRYRFKDAEIDALMHKLIPGFERMLDQVMDDAGGVHNEGYASLDPEGATINAIIFESHSVEFIGKTVDRKPLEPLAGSQAGAPRRAPARALPPTAPGPRRERRGGLLRRRPGSHRVRRHPALRQRPLDHPRREA